jgi:two-component SAPR family response regulator
MDRRTAAGRPHLHVVGEEQADGRVSGQGQPRACVLVVQNEIFPDTLLLERIAKHGFRIAGPFNRAFKASDWLETETPDVAMLDIALWDGASFDLAYELQARNVPFLFYTSWRDIEQIPFDLRERPFLEKPDHGALVPRLLSKLMEG